MAESIYSWIQDLACFFILASAVMHFIPENNYRKYVQFYMGLLLILVILSPVFQFTDLEEEIRGFVGEFQYARPQGEEWEKKAEDWAAFWEEDIEGEAIEGEVIEGEAVEGQEVVP